MDLVTPENAEKWQVNQVHHEHPRSCHEKSAHMHGVHGPQRLHSSEWDFAIPELDFATKQKHNLCL